MKQTDGFLEINGHQTYYKIVGESTNGQPPLLVLHGGPGSAHNYLFGLAKLAEQGRQVIFYDQLGCGLSDEPKNDSLWTIQLFLNELTAVREQLKLDTIDLLGQSWGGMLAIEYLLTKPTGVRSVILASSMIDIPLYQAEVDILKADLPRGIYRALINHEAAGTTDSEGYQSAMQMYNKSYIFRSDEWPAEYLNPNAKPNDAYRVMWGPSEALVNGSLVNWTLLNRLSEITMPTLITSGEFDELTPKQAKLTQSKISGSQLKIFEGGSHCCHIEYEADYLKTVSSFLDSINC